MNRKVVEFVTLALMESIASTFEKVINTRTAYMGGNERTTQRLATVCINQAHEKTLQSMY